MAIPFTLSEPAARLADSFPGGMLRLAFWEAARVWFGIPPARIMEAIQRLEFDRPYLENADYFRAGPVFFRVRPPVGAPPRMDPIRSARAEWMTRLATVRNERDNVMGPSFTITIDPNRLWRRYVPVVQFFERFASEPFPFEDIELAAVHAAALPTLAAGEYSSLSLELI